MLSVSTAMWRQQANVTSAHTGLSCPDKFVVSSCFYYYWLVILLSLASNQTSAETVLPEVNVKADRVSSKEQRYPDLQEDNALNPYRVAPSSRLSVQKLTAKDIDDLKPTNVFELLNHAVGVLTLYQGRKVPYSVRIRGDLYFGYIIDGIYVPSEAGARILQNLPVSAIEQVEVVRDSTALTLGPMVDFGRPSGAPNDGFIIVRTRRPVKTEATVLGRVESFDTKSAMGFAGTAGKYGYVSGMANHYETDGKANQYMAKNSNTWQLRAGAEGFGLRAEFSAYHDETNQQIQAGDPYETFLGLQRWQLAPIQTTFWGGTLSSQQTGFWTEQHSSIFNVSGYNVDALQINGTVLPGIAPRLIPNLEDLVNFDFKHTIRYLDTLVRVGGQYMHWDTPTGSGYYEGYPRNEIVKGAFITAEQGFFEKKLIVDAAGRLDGQYIVQGVDHFYADPMRYSLPETHNKLLPASRFATLGAAYQPWQQTKINGRIYYAQQGAVENVAPVPDTILHPEGQKKAELGISYDRWTQFHPALTGFFVHLDNVKYPALTVRDREGIVRTLWDETAVNRYGFELMVNGQVRWEYGSTRYRFGWTYITGDTTNQDYGRTTPPNTFNLLLEHSVGPWEINLSALRVDKFYSNWKAVDGQFHPIGDYFRLDTNFARKFAVGSTVARVALYGRNLLGQRYETQLGFRDPGTVLGVELRLNL